jgi:hypothetical protein
MGGNLSGQVGKSGFEIHQQQQIHNNSQSLPPSEFLTVPVADGQLTPANGNTD